MGLAEVFEKIEAAKKQESARPAPAPVPSQKPKVADFSPTGVAVMVRKALRDKFPTGKFRVTTSKYSGGSSIDVKWTDGPAADDVEKMVGHMHGADFDGMQDLKVHNDSPYGNDYIFCQRRYSSEAYRTAGLTVAKDYGITVPVDISTDTLLATWVPGQNKTVGELATRALSGTTLPVRNFEL